MDPSSAGTIDRSNDAAARRLNRLNCKNSCGLRVPFRANRLANIIAGAICTLVNGFLTFVPPLFGARTPALPEYLFFATIETVCTSVIIWQAWTWSGVEVEVSTERSVRQPEAGIISS
jgi:hypothetical protein